MPTAMINTNEIYLNVGTPGVLQLKMSLQRHHYCYCHDADALQINSLLYSSVTEQNAITDVLEVGAQMERLLNSNHRPHALFGVQFRCLSGRTYLVDNSALNPNGFPNHFFPTSGTSVWGRMTQKEYIAARAIRRVEEAIKPTSGVPPAVSPGRTLAPCLAPSIPSSPVMCKPMGHLLLFQRLIVILVWSRAARILWLWGTYVAKLRAVPLWPYSKVA